MVRRAALILVLLALWFLLSGYLDHPTLIGFGIASVVVTVLVAERAGVLDREGVPSQLFPGLIPYMIWLTLEIGKANFLVAREVLRPRLRVAPQMVRVPARPFSDVGKVIFGNSVTLTPGTVTVDLTGDTLLVHALTPDFADVEAMEEMGRKVTRFDAAARASR